MRAGVAMLCSGHAEPDSRPAARPRASRPGPLQRPRRAMRNRLHRALAAELAAGPEGAARRALAEALELLGWQAEAAALLRLQVRQGTAGGAAATPVRLAGLTLQAAPAATAERDAEAAARGAPALLRLAAWQGVLAAFPGNVAAHMEIGHALRGGGDPAAALPHFAAA